MPAFFIFLPSYLNYMSSQFLFFFTRSHRQNTYKYKYLPGCGEGGGWWRKDAIHNRIVREILAVVLLAFQKSFQETTLSQHKYALNSTSYSKSVYKLVIYLFIVATLTSTHFAVMLHTRSAPSVSSFCKGTDKMIMSHTITVFERHTI
jgi:hypothetical protein